MCSIYVERIADKLRRKERATLAEVRKSSEMLNSWSVNIDKGRKASKRGEWKCGASFTRIFLCNKFQC